MDPIVAKEVALAALLPIFLRGRAEDVTRLGDAVLVSDFNAIRTIGHNLRGNGASYGFPKLSAIGEAIEQGASAKDREAILREAERLAEALEQIEASKLSAQPALK
jgi:HPt (histidine-containing phosphotransfer) domain-containing protein